MTSGPVLAALLIGAIAAITSGVIGVFSVLRTQSFAGHSLADIATTGGAAAFLVGISQFWGFLVAGIAASATMEAIGVQRRRGRDVATGVVLGGALGLAALFLYLGTQRTSTTGASFSILFGSIFVVSPDTIPAIIGGGVVALLAVAILGKRLLLTAISPDLARARGVNVRLTGILFLMALAVTVSLSAVAIGAVLSTALLVGPAATALRVTRSPGRAVLVSAGTGLAATWLGICARLRVLLLAAAWPWLASELLRGHPRPGRLPAVVRAPAPAGAATAFTPRGGRMFSSLMFTGLMANTWIAASIVACVAGMTGFFAVLRGETFAAHAIPNGAFAGAAGASLLGINVIWGLAAFAIAGALGIGALGSKARHDVVTALALVLMLGLGALFISVSSQYAQQAYSLLFGEVYGVSTAEVWPIAGIGVIATGCVALAFRRLMFTSAMPEVAEARGVSVRGMEIYFLLVMALATSMTVPVVGALLMFSLMIGPAAAARSVTARPGVALALSVAIALATVWLSIALSYRTNWPLGFFVGVGGALFYLVGLAARGLGGGARARAVS